MSETTGKFADNPNYVTVEQGTIKIHELIAIGQCDSYEADFIRDAMDKPYWSLSQEEIDRVSGLSADLYMITKEEVRSKTDLNENVQEKLELAVKNNDYPMVLKMLGKEGHDWPIDRVAAMRAKAYAELGHSEAGHKFYDFYKTLNPTDQMADDIISTSVFGESPYMILMLSSGPGFLFRNLKTNRYVLKLAKRPLQELVDSANDSTAKNKNQESFEEKSKIYSILTAILLHDSKDQVLELMKDIKNKIDKLKSEDKNYDTWIEYFVNRYFEEHTK